VDPSSELQKEEVAKQAAGAAGIAASKPDRELASVPPTAAHVASILSEDKFAELSSYAQLKSKVFMNDGEKKERARLLSSGELAKSLEKVLLTAALDAQARQVQNDAVDFLLEANTPVAAEVLRNVIQDKQIENANLPLSERHALAGVKGEVLYRWTAQDPSRADQARRLLPGDVSKRVWDNVTRSQRQNLAESTHELSE
jgi:hypothetical protein